MREDCSAYTKEGMSRLSFMHFQLKTICYNYILTRKSKLYVIYFCYVLCVFVRCDLTLILLEMDRILRPEGTVVLRDNVETLTKVERIVKGMKWKSQLVDHEKGPNNPEKILVAVKSYWTGQPSNKNNDNNNNSNN